MSSRNQGEGDRESARRFNEDEQKFVQSGRVAEAARQAAPRDANEQQQMQQAEEAAKSHAKDEDPTVPGANATHQPQAGTGAPRQPQGGAKR